MSNGTIISCSICRKYACSPVNTCVFCRFWPDERWMPLTRIEAWGKKTQREEERCSSWRSSLGLVGDAVTSFVRAFSCRHCKMMSYPSRPRQVSVVLFHFDKQIQTTFILQTGAWDKMCSLSLRRNNLSSCLDKPSTQILVSSLLKISALWIPESDHSHSLYPGKDDPCCSSKKPKKSKNKRPHHRDCFALSGVLYMHLVESQELEMPSQLALTGDTH